MRLGKRRERMLLAVLAFLTVLQVSGLALMALEPGVARIGRILLGVGATGMMLFITVTRRIDHLHGLRGSGGDEYDELRGRSTLRALGLSSNAMWLLAIAVMMVAVSIRMGFINNVDEQSSLRTALALGAGVTFVNAAAVVASFLVPHNDEDHGWTSDAVTLTSLAIVGMLSAVVGATGSQGLLAEDGSTIVSPHDAVWLAVGALALTALGSQVTRGIPTFASLFGKTNADDIHDPLRRRSLMVAPTITAMALLFFVLLALVTYGVGFVDVLLQVSESPLLLLVMLGSVGLIIGAVAVAFQVAGRTAKAGTQLFQEKKSHEEQQENLILGVSSAIGFLILGFAGAVYMGKLPMAQERWLDICAVAVMVWIGPYGFWVSKRAKNTKLMEERFPDFLRDLASSHKGGLTLYAAVAVAARGDYGSLTKEIRKMAQQLSWHVSFEEALQRFADRANTPLIRRGVSLVLEAGRSGGNTAEVLMAAARDARELKTLESDRRLNMSLYVIIIYITFAVFLMVASIMYASFVPELLRTSEAAKELGASSAGGVNFANDLTAADYRTFYFLAAIVQGVGDGVVAGIMSTGRAMLGLKHSFIMLLITWMVFVLFI
ncbi:MAG: type II secretion system F family protein [Thermoplasmatota archaeon]